MADNLRESLLKRIREASEVLDTEELTKLADNLQPNPSVSRDTDECTQPAPKKSKTAIQRTLDGSTQPSTVDASATKTATIAVEQKKLELGQITYNNKQFSNVTVVDWGDIANSLTLKHTKKELILPAGLKVTVQKSLEPSRRVLKVVSVEGTTIRLSRSKETILSIAFRTKISAGKVQFIASAHCPNSITAFIASAPCDTPNKALAHFCSQNNFEFKDPRCSVYCPMDNDHIQTQIKSLWTLFTSSLQQPRPASNTMKTKSLSEVAICVQQIDFECNDKPEKFNEESERVVVRGMLAKLQDCLLEGRDPENRARLVLRRLFEHREVKPFLEIELERKWQWSLKSQKVISHVVQNLKCAVEEYKCVKSKLGRDIYQILLRILHIPKQFQLQRATALLFGLSSREGLRSAQAMMSEAAIGKDLEASGRHRLPTFDPPSKLLGNVKYDYAGQLSERDAKQLEEFGDAVCEARKMLALSLQVVDDLEGTIQRTIGNPSRKEAALQQAKTTVATHREKFRSAEKQLDDFERSLADKCSQLNIELAKRNQEKYNAHQSLLVSYSQLLDEIMQNNLKGPEKQEKSSGTLDPKKRKTRRDKIERKIELLAVLWWVMKTRVTANVKDVAERNGKSYPTHWLEDTIRNFWLHFLSSDPVNLHYADQAVIRGVSPEVLPGDISKSFRDLGVEVTTKKGGPDYFYCKFKKAADLNGLLPFPKTKGTLPLEGQLALSSGSERGQKVRITRRPKIGLTKFTWLRPFFVKDVCGSTCVCEKCWDMKNLLKDTIAFPHWPDAAPRMADLVDDLHQLSAPFSPTPVNLLELLLCPRDPTTGQFNMDCCQGRCTRKDAEGRPFPCGWQRYFGDDLEVADVRSTKNNAQHSEPLSVKYHSYQNQEIPRPKEQSDSEAKVQKQTRTVLQTAKKPPSLFVELLQSSVEAYMEHFAIAVHQDKYEKLRKEILLDSKLEECICVDMDFAENYEIVHRIEIQSEHWSHSQVTLFIVITHHLEKDNPEGSSKVVSEAQIFVSEDGSHDTFFVQHAMDKLQHYFKTERNMTFSRWYINTDGAPSHFKNKYTMHSLKVFLEKSGAASVMWETCAPGHGKGPWDGIGAVIKRTIRALEVRHPAKYYHHNALDVYFTLVHHFSGWKKGLSQRCSVDKFNFFYIKKDNLDNKEIESRRNKLEGQLASYSQQLGDEGKNDEKHENRVEEKSGNGGHHDVQSENEEPSDLEEEEEEEEDTLLPILHVPETGSQIDPFAHISGPIRRPEKGRRKQVSNLKYIRSHFSFLVEATRQRKLGNNQCHIQMRFLSCACRNCSNFDFKHCTNKMGFSDSNSYILEATGGSEPTKTRTTKAIDSDKRRKLARVAVPGQFLAVENPDKSDPCKFWLAKVQGRAFQHKGASKVVNGVRFVDKGYYIEIHVFKPKMSRMDGTFNFQWDRNPYGSGRSAWMVDAESVIFCLPEGSVTSVGRRSARNGNAGQDQWEMKQISDELFEEVMENYYGMLGELPS